MGSDFFFPGAMLKLNNFNPRFHYGKRLLVSSREVASNFTSIHASTMGSDIIDGLGDENINNFNPRFHYGKRQLHIDIFRLYLAIYCV